MCKAESALYESGEKQFVILNYTYNYTRFFLVHSLKHTQIVRLCIIIDIFSLNAKRQNV
jgi:hypothetical protein